MISPYDRLSPSNANPMLPTDPQGTRFVRSVALDIVLTLLTCGLWNLRVQYVQIQAINAILGVSKYSFWKWLGLTVITCGLYHIYHEYLKSVDIAKSLKKTNEEPILEIVLIALGLSIVADAIQQSQINRYFGSQSAY